MSTRIRLRRADYGNWHTDNPTLDYGEVGLVFDTISSTNTLVGFKVGDGSTTWRNLLMHRMPTSSTTDGDGLGADGTGAEGAGEPVTTWDQIALLGRTQTFSTVQTFQNQIISTHSDDANAIQVNTDKFTVKGNDGDTAIAGTLAVTGATTLTGALAANGGITCDTDKFTVADTTGNTAIKGTLHVNNTTDGDVFTVGANAGSGFTVHGNDGDTSIAGTLTVTGAVTGTSTIVGAGDSYTASAVNTGATFLGSAIWKRTITVSAGSGLVNIQPGDVFANDVTDIDKLIKQEWHQCSMQWHTDPDSPNNSAAANGSASTNHYLAGGAVSGNFNRNHNANHDGVTSFCVAALNRFDPRDGSTAASNSLFWAGIAGLDDHVGVADLVRNNDSGKTGIDAIVTIWYTKS